MIQVAHEAEQIAHQVQQLQNEAQMLLNQAQNLQHLDFNIVGRLQANLATTERLLSQNRGMAFELTQAEQLFGQQYPLQYTASTSRDQMQVDAMSRWTNSLLSLMKSRPGKHGRSIASIRSSTWIAST